MKNKHLYALLDTSYTTIKVVYEPEQMAPVQAPAAPGSRARTIPPWGQPERSYTGQAYTYKVPKDAGVAVDDFVVVYTERRGLLLARVVEVHNTPQIDLDANYDYKWIVQRVDMDPYRARVTLEDTFAQAMLEIERTNQRESMIRGFTSNLPEGSEARKLFDQTIQSLQSPTIDVPPAPKTK